MPDSVELEIKLGNWMDGVAPSAFHIPIADEPDLADLQVGAMNAGLNPWQSERHYVSYYANASADHAVLVLALFPVVGQALLDGTAKVVAQVLLTKVLSLLTPDNTFVATDASEFARMHLLRYAGVALTDLVELSSERLEDGAYQVVYRDQRSGTEHLVLVDHRGVVGHANLRVVEEFQHKASTLQERHDPGH